MANFIYQWIDFIWLPIGWFVVHKDHRIMTVSFVLSCLLTMRAQVELFTLIDKAHGMINLMQSHIFDRGLISYSIIIMLFLILAYFSPRTQKIVFFAATLSLYVLALCVTTLIMTL